VSFQREIAGYPRRGGPAATHFKRDSKFTQKAVQLLVLLCLAGSWCNRPLRGTTLCRDLHPNIFLPMESKCEGAQTQHCTSLIQKRFGRRFGTVRMETLTLGPTTTGTAAATPSQRSKSSPAVPKSSESDSATGGSKRGGQAAPRGSALSSG
jgi:hypothetical protein